MPLHCCFIQISQLVPLREFNIQNLLLLWPPYTFQSRGKKKNKKKKPRHEALSHSLKRTEVMLPTALSPVLVSKTKPPLLNQTEEKGHLISRSRKSSH